MTLADLLTCARCDGVSESRSACPSGVMEAAPVAVAAVEAAAEAGTPLGPSPGAGGAGAGAAAAEAEAREARDSRRRRPIPLLTPLSPPPLPSAWPTLGWPGFVGPTDVDADDGESEGRSRGGPGAVARGTDVEEEGDRGGGKGECGEVAGEEEAEEEAAAAATWVAADGESRAKPRERSPNEPIPPAPQLRLLKQLRPPAASAATMPRRPPPLRSASAAAILVRRAVAAPRGQLIANGLEMVAG